MKTLLVISLSVFVLNSCGELANFDITSTNINDLYQGYTIEGHNTKNNVLRFTYCDAGYTYKRGTEFFAGRFNINNSQVVINMFDAKGGSYIWDTSTGYINVGQEYYIYDVNDEIIVDGIYKSNCI